MKRIFLTLILLVILCSSQFAQLSGPQGIKSLEEGFRNPPDEAKPRTWWHWTNSNITHDGITKDLEWMKRAGIGGMQLADVASGSGQTVEKKIPFGSEDWLNAVRHAASEADRLGLEMTLFSSPGWSLTGGPWVKPEQAMKKLVWSETIVSGPAEYKAKLSDPPSIEGPIQNLSRNTRVLESDPRFYRDFKVLAFRTPVDELSESQLRPVITTSGGTINADALLDDDLNSSATIRSANDKKIVWIEFDFGNDVTIRSLSMANRAGIPVGKLLAGKNINSYSTVAVLPGAQLYRAGKVETITFPEVTARFFRLEFTGSPMKPADVMAETQTLPDSLYTFGQIRFHTAARINRWEDKAGFYHLFSYDPVKSIDVSSSSVIKQSDVLDITSMMSSDGTLQWKVPAGSWTIMRFGYSLTGSKNRPAVPSGSGYEVDKLSREHSEEYIKAYTDPIAGALGSLYGKSLQYVLLDSWEAGMQNWTEKMTEEFRMRRGYDLTPFLPCLAGHVVGSSEISDRVLWDFRRTLADMFAENHYAVITDYLHKQGIRTYGEASGVSLEILEDALLCKKYVDIPMGEFWYRALHPELMYYQDVRGAASAAHIQGKSIVAAEAFTGGGFESPYTLKKIGDYWFTQGINRFVFHTSAHQPLDTKPGNTMVGTHINRNITWAEQAGPFMEYLSRNSFMLQQGKSVADLVYLLDEGAPSTMPIWGSGLIPFPPEGYDYDYINASTLVNEMRVDELGHLVLPGGAEYSILVLPQTIKMTLPVLRKIKELVEGGAVILGPKPVGTPGYSAYPGSEKELSQLAMEVWGDIDGISRTKRYCGKGRVYWGTPLKTVLESEKLVPDLEYGKPLNAKIDWIHRRTVDAEIYFLVNSSDIPLTTRIRFRVTGKEAWLWEPVSGTTRAVPYTVSGNSTFVDLNLSERESVFVLFRDKINEPELSAAKVVQSSELQLTGPWEIRFPENLGAPASIIIDTLKSWTLFKDEGIKYFSGTASYSKSVPISKSFLNGSTKVIMDLGAVADIAEVKINGKKTTLCWSPPYQTDITGLLIPGTNSIEIHVTNEWTNRLAGDMKLPAGQKILNSSLFVRPGFISPSGLMGPVKLVRYQ